MYPVCCLNHCITVSCIIIQCKYSDFSWRSKDVKIAWQQASLYARCVNTSCSMAFSWSWTVQTTWRWAFSFSRMKLLPTSSPTEFESNWMTYDFHIIEPIKRTQGPMFMSQDNMQEDLVHWFRQQPKELFADGICQLVHPCYSCLITCGDFFYCKIFTCEDSVVHTSYENMKKVVRIWSFNCTVTWWNILKNKTML